MERKTKYWFDTEFIDDGESIDLISIGIVCEDGREFYAENVQVWSYLSDAANDWVIANVIPHLWSFPLNKDKKEANGWSRDGGEGGLLRLDEIANSIVRFIAAGERPPEFWAYYGAYDWVVLMQLYGAMVDHPDGWPMFCMDIMQYATMKGIEDWDADVSKEWKLPAPTGTQHHALEDARWTKEAWHFLNQKTLDSMQMHILPSDGPNDYSIP